MDCFLLLIQTVLLGISENLRFMNFCFPPPAGGILDSSTAEGRETLKDQLPEVVLFFKRGSYHGNISLSGGMTKGGACINKPLSPSKKPCRYGEDPPKRHGF
jgi:hypothetical protein